MKSYTEFFTERAFSPRGQAARDVMKKQNDINAARNAADRQQKAAKVGVTPPSKQKALPPAKSSPKSPADIGAEMLKKKANKGGALAKSTADKGSALAVRPKPGTDGPGERQARKPKRHNNKPRTLTEPTGDDLVKKKDNQFLKGFNRNLGVASTNKNVRDVAYRKAGANTANAIKSAPGKAMPKVTSQSVGGKDALISKLDVKSYN